MDSIRLAVACRVLVDLVGVAVTIGVLVDGIICAIAIAILVHRLESAVAIAIFLIWIARRWAVVLTIWNAVSVRIIFWCKNTWRAGRRVFFKEFLSQPGIEFGNFF